MPASLNKIRYQCPSCSAAVSLPRAFIGEVVDCPRCGQPFLPKVPEAVPLKGETQTSGEDFEIVRPANDERILREIHPALFRQHPVQLMGLSLLTIALIIGAIAGLVTGLIPGFVGALLGILIICVYFGFWYVEKISTVLIVTNKRSTLRKGIISKTTTEVQHDDIRNIQVQQNAMERILSVGNLAISSSGQNDLEVHIKGIAHPNDVADLIRSMQ